MPGFCSLTARSQWFRVQIYPGCRAEGADAADAWTACQQQLLLLACRPHPALAALLAEAWGGIIGCARAPGGPPRSMRPLRPACLPPQVAAAGFPTQGA
jgi:hypothetical protein